MDGFLRHNKNKALLIALTAIIIVATAAARPALTDRF